MTSTKALQRISEIFGQQVTPLCVPDGNGGCRFVGAGHGPDCLHPSKSPLVKGWQSPDCKLSPEALEQYAKMGGQTGVCAWATFLPWCPGPGHKRILTKQRS